MNSSFYLLLIILTLCNILFNVNIVSSVTINNNKHNNKNNEQPIINLPIQTVTPLPMNGDVQGSLSQVGAEGCSICIGFLDDYLPTLVNIISEYGVIESCSKICGFLNKTVEIDICTTLCDAVGVDEFWKVFVTNDINPFYACQLIDACNTPKNPAANFIGLELTPTTGAAGQTFSMDLSFQVINTTGAGQFAFIVYYTQTQNKFIYYQTYTSYTPGAYSVKYNFPTTANSTFVDGQYPITVAMCNGQCGSMYSSILNQTSSYFTIVNPTPTPTPTPTTKCFYYYYT